MSMHREDWARLVLRLAETTAGVLPRGPRAAAVQAFVDLMEREFSPAERDHVANAIAQAHRINGNEAQAPTS